MRFLDTTDQPTYGIGICDRCSRKMPLAELFPDPNSPGLKVCLDDRDEFDPYRLPPKQPDQISLPFYRPDTPMTFEAAHLPAIPNDTVLGNVSGENDISVPVPIYAMMTTGNPVVSKTADYTLAVADSFNDFDNNGAATTVIFHLPVDVIGLSYGFAVEAARAVVIKAPIGVTLRLGELSSTPGGTLTASSVGAYVFLRCRTPTDWFALYSAGSWSAA